MSASVILTQPIIFPETEILGSIRVKPSGIRTDRCMAGIRLKPKTYLVWRIRRVGWRMEFPYISDLQLGIPKDLIERGGGNRELS